MPIALINFTLNQWGSGVDLGF